MDNPLVGTLLGWLLVIGIGVPVSIALHELGHLVPAKRFGVRCTQYFVGFGPTLWSRRVGDTEYGVKWIPLGGYVRMLGMFPPKPGRPARADSTGRLGLWIDAAREDAQREITPADADRLFYQRSVPQRLVIMLGGPLMNLLIAIALLTALLTQFGLLAPTTTVDSVSKCVVPVSADTSRPQRTECAPSDPRAPAAAAGLRAGDRIVAFDGRPVETWSQVRDAIRTSPGRTVEIVVDRDGTRTPLSATLLTNTGYALDAEGDVIEDGAGRVRTQQVGFLGVAPEQVNQPTPAAEVPGYVGDMLGQVVGAIPQIPAKMLGVARTVFGGAERDPESMASIVGVGRMAGEIGAEQELGGEAVTWPMRFWSWVGLLAGLNMALFALNLIPLLPLDGGHVAGALWEAVRRRANRLLRRPDPGPVDLARALPLTYAVSSVFLVMAVLLIYADIVAPIRLTG